MSHSGFCTLPLSLWRESGTLFPVRWLSGKKNSLPEPLTRSSLIAKAGTSMMWSLRPNSRLARSLSGSPSECAENDCPAISSRTESLIRSKSRATLCQCSGFMRSWGMDALTRLCRPSSFRRTTMLSPLLS